MRLNDGQYPSSAPVQPALQRARGKTQILTYLFHEGLTSRADLARAVGLNRLTVAELTAELLDEGLIEEHGVQRGVSGGKSLMMLGMSTHGFQIVGIEIDDELRGAVMSLRGSILYDETRPTNGAQGDDLTELVEEFAMDVMSHATTPVIGLGIGAPGMVDADGTVIYSPNYGWKDVPLASLLTERLGLPVLVANDASAAAVGEHAFGRAADSMIVLVTWTGLGAGVMADGRRVHGAFHGAGEIGHVTFDFQGEKCSCGRLGCFQKVFSGDAIRAAIAGLDDEARDAKLHELGRMLGRVLSPVTAMLDSEEVLILGDPELMDGTLRAAAEERLKEGNLVTDETAVKVRMGALGDKAVMLGAAGLVLEAQLGVS
ncbi:MAG: ROK family protein [Cellulomonadaceae bacterium]|nr:ROK family protein [Cellulomonadaceae bacterium]